MNKLISCEFNIDTTCVELYFTDRSMISIECTVLYLVLEDNHRRLQGRLSFRLTALYSDERRSKASAWAKMRGIQAGK